MARSERRAILAGIAVCGLLGTGRAAAPPVTSPQGGATPGPEAASLPPLSLADHLNTLLSAEFLADARVSVFAVDGDTGDVLYERGADEWLNPASNAKLMTSAAALDRLGPEYRWVTRTFAADKDAVRDGVVHGDLWLEGSGDPALVTGDLYELATSLRAAGIKKITGAIVVDGTRFDKDGLPPGFDQKDELASYRAPMGACSVNFNSFEVRIQPGSAVGQPLVATIVPPISGVTLHTQATAGPGWRNRLQLKIEADEKSIEVALSGTLGVDAGPAEYRYPVTSPSRHAGEVFALVLDHAGVKVGKRGIKLGEVPREAKLLATHRSETLSVLLRGVNKLSNNFMAEQILRSLAPEDHATAEAALTAVREYARGVGLPQGDLRIGNGSGLYDNNRISARALVQLLRHVHLDFRIRADFLASLPIMGRDGTLRRRLKDTDGATWIRAKTGTLDGVSALSGYVGAMGKNSPVVFAVLMNELGRWESGKAKAIQDQIALALAHERAGTPMPILSAEITGEIGDDE